MEENPVQMNFKDERFTILLVHTLAETTTDSNFHQAEPISGNTDRGDVKSNNEPASKHKEKIKKSTKRRRSPTPSSDSKSGSKSDNLER